MRSYADPVDVNRGLVAGQEAPSQFIWRDRLWVVRDIVSHWIETGAWWDQPEVAALFGRTSSLDSGNGGVARRDAAGSRGDEPVGGGAGGLPAGGESARAGSAGSDRGSAGADLLGEREVWRVEAVRGQQASGVFDLSFDWASGRWLLVGVAD